MIEYSGEKGPISDESSLRSAQMNLSKLDNTVYEYQVSLNIIYIRQSWNYHESMNQSWIVVLDRTPFCLQDQAGSPIALQCVAFA